MNIKAAAKNDIGKIEALANAKLEPVVAVMASGHERISYDATRADEPASFAAIALGIAVGAVNA